MAGDPVCPSYHLPHMLFHWTNSFNCVFFSSRGCSLNRGRKLLSRALDVYFYSPYVNMPRVHKKPQLWWTQHLPVVNKGFVQAWMGPWLKLFNIICSRERSVTRLRGRWASVRVEDNANPWYAWHVGGANSAGRGGQGYLVGYPSSFCSSHLSCADWLLKENAASGRIEVI